MNYKVLLPIIGLTLIVAGLTERGWFLILIWLGVDFLILGVAHWQGFHGIFGKRADGSLPFWNLMAFFPLHAYAISTWHLIRLFNREQAFNEVTADLVVGRRLLPNEVKGNFDNYVDLTAEFVEPSAIRHLPSYNSFPILDGSAPTPHALRMEVVRLRAGRTFIHCAQGHGRTGLFALAILLTSGKARTVNEGIQMLASVRPGIRLNQDQHRCIQMYSKQFLA